jgi:hypothetical protein
MMAAIERNLPQRTGKTLRQWLALLKRQGPRKRREHGLGGATIMLIAAAAEGRKPHSDYDDAPALVDAMYSGKKAALRPAYEAALRAAKRLGTDVVPGARKTYVSLSRRKQFAVLQPSTADRLDLGLVLPGVEGAGRLEACATVGSGRVTHRIVLRSAKDVDAFVRRWLEAAYERA